MLGALKLGEINGGGGKGVGGGSAGNPFADDGDDDVVGGGVDGAGTAEAGCRGWASFASEVRVCL